MKIDINLNKADRKICVGDMIIIENNKAFLIIKTYEKSTHGSQFMRYSILNLETCLTDRNFLNYMNIDLLIQEFSKMHTIIKIIRNKNIVIKEEDNNNDDWV